MELLDEILEILTDGKWHAINELISIANGTPIEVLLCLKLLEHYHFIWIRKDEVQLWGSIKDFLKEIKKLEN